MNTKYKIAMGMLAGVALGAAAVQGLHAQAKPKAYIVTESELLDAAALAAYTPQAQAAVKAAGGVPGVYAARARSEEHTSELQSLAYLVCRLLLEKKKKRVNPFAESTTMQA